MPTFVTLSCPNCGGKLQITEDIDRFACAHCGQEQIVKRSGGIVTLAPVVDAIKRVEVGVDKTAAELAMSRLEREIHDLGTQRNQLADESPTPGGLSLFLGMGLGVIGLCPLLFAVVIFLNGRSSGGVWLAFGVVLLLIGAALFYFSRWASKQWDQTTGQQLKQLDQMISSRQGEWEEHRKTVVL